MSRPRLFSLFAVMSALGIGLAARSIAQQGNKLEQRFERFDTNHDGLLSGSELDGTRVLRSLDLDGDGSVTKAEALKALLQQRKPSASDSSSAIADASKTRPVFTRLDKNGDGKLSPRELNNAEIFAKLDVDKDQAVTLDEALKVIGEVIPERWRGQSPGGTAATALDEKSLQEQPQQLKGDEHGIGRRVPEMKLTDTSGREVSLGKLAAQGKGLVIAMFGATCPISGKLGPEMARLEKEFSARGIAFLHVCPVAGEAADDIAKFISTHSLTSPVVPDEKAALAGLLSASTTTEVFVLDAAQTLVYRGAINDQYGLGYAKEKATQHYLREALLAALAGQRPSVTATSAPGCALDLPKAAAQPVAASALTYHRDISRIVQGHCTECHRADGLAPFSLETYADLIKHAGMVKKQVARGAMPPWFAAPQPAGQESPWANDCSLSPRDKADLLTWLESDRAEGDAAEAPLARAWPGEWSIGKPDLIVQLPRPVAIKAEGTMPYQVLQAETTLAEDRWVSGYEIIPTDRAVVHHVIVTAHDRGAKIARSEEEGVGGYWAAYVPGNSKQIYPPGFARKLPAGTVFSFQIHYTPNGKATTDQLRMGLVFAKDQPRYQVLTASVPKRRLNIPPGKADHIEVIDRPVPTTMNVMAYMAHMHVRGAAFKFELKRADGGIETLLDIPRYDFNWQLRYDLARPRVVHQGEVLRLSAKYDNSPGNAANPDPSATVHWGPQTQDEMMIGYIEHFVPIGDRDVAEAQP